MAKKESTTSVPVAEVNEQKMRKKQAKREAKMMLEIEETKVSIEKAEKKLAKAQASLEARKAHLRTLEVDLSEFRISHKEIEVSAPDAGFDHQTGQPELKEETEISAQHDDSEQQIEQPASKDEETNEISAQHGDTEQETEQPASEEEATIPPDDGSDHQAAQSELEEITSSNQ